MLDFQKLSATYQQALLRQVVPFWLKNSRDEQCGGYIDLLSATGDQIEGDKFVTLQAQQAWTFAWLYNTLDGQPAWLEHASHGVSFLSQFAHDDSLACYAQLDRRGRPVAQSVDLVPASFAVMAYAQMHRATNQDEWAMLAKQVFSYVLEHRTNVLAEQATMLGGFRPIRHLSETVAVLKMVLGMQPLLAEDSWKQTIDLVVQDILHGFMDRRTDTLREFILPEGAFMNTPEGRRLNVGLSFQTACYLFDFYTESASVKTGSVMNSNRRLAMQVVTWCLRLCEQAWDEANAGLNPYIDVKQQPFIFPDWQQKWAWVQVEALTALLKGYEHTRHPDCLKWFKRIHDYTFQHFPDTKQTGWHLALDQHAQPLLAAKATPMVGCFSLIRCIAEIGKLLTTLAQTKERTSRAGISINAPRFTEEA
ncbi:AGE family epimerase/isomerase [Spirosoma radiotolerans]|uniref:N-acyl-D-glucosamine 2-epimerase n=1 Tax=Spirosoma radiotolerans TaxID=1379870 RepID=A0A0E3ZZ76_9BACT|nr:AGE family epimerase/isomerase [Spirosoma radiotolerans]AKD57388.1 N-acyl-D-glucosamine 2-epimerase [Spirosoma radiotolerans]